MDLSEVMKAIGGIEAKLNAFSEKAGEEIKANGKVSSDTIAAIDSLGIKQREIADRLLAIEQKGVALVPELQGLEGWGQQFTKSDAYAAYVSGSAQKARVEVKNTVTNAIGNTFSDRKPGIVGGASRVLTLESMLTSLPTSSNAVDYVKESVFTNAAAETAEGVAKPESAVTTALVTEPVATVAHWIKISRQLAADNAALAAYINMRMVYGVNLRVENQIINGTGVAPNIAGFTKAGNFTAHGYTAAALGTVNQRLKLIRKMIADAMGSDYPADTIVLNPADWAEIELLVDSQNRYLVGDPSAAAEPKLWGLPVVQSNALTADNVLVASLALSATFYNREGIVVELSDSDSDNFTKNLVTVRAERRCMLAVERPAAVRYGDLTPA